MNIDSDLSGVLASSMCIGCGACVAVDPSLELQLDPVKLIYEPDHPGNRAAASVCPAVQVDFDSLQERLFPGRERTPFGVVESVMLAQSTDYERNYAASSGGLIKELLIQLLSREDVDGAIALKQVAGLDFTPTLIRDPGEVDELPGSIYHNLAQPETIRLLSENEGRFVVVAIPCQLEGIYNYIFKCEPRLQNRIYMTIGLLCGWQYSHHSLKAICEFKGISYDDIRDISYRGGGPVGKLRIATDKDVVETSRRIDFDYQVAFDRHFNTPRCHVCINHHNVLADLVVGDAWLPSTVWTRTGISLIANRSVEAENLVLELVDQDRIKLTRVTVEEIKASQKPRVVFGDFAYAYMEFLNDSSLHAPRMTAENRLRASPVDRHEVETFHLELMRKLELQRHGRYRYLWWRKLTKELSSLISRYWEWFLVRILRIKSLTGEREEVPRDQLSSFR